MPCSISEQVDGFCDFLGVFIRRKVDTQDISKSFIELSQNSYSEKILKRSGLEDSRPVSTPAEPDRFDQVATDTESQEPEVMKDLLKQQQKMLGSLLYKVGACRPDLAFATHLCSTQKPSVENITRLKRIFRYLRGSKAALRFNYESAAPRVVCYSDASLANAPSGHSIQGNLVLINNHAVYWAAKKQTSVALHTAESELRACSDAVRNAFMINYLLQDLAVPGGAPPEPGIKVLTAGETPTQEASVLLPIACFCGNESVIKIVNSAISSARTRHIRIRLSFMREALLNKPTTLN